MTLHDCHSFNRFCLTMIFYLSNLLQDNGFNILKLCKYLLRNKMPFDLSLFI